MTKRQENIISRYYASKATTLRDVYKSWSSRKEEAYMDCVRMKVDLDGDNLRIIGANTDKFSVGFTFTNDDGEKCLMYITPSRNEVIRLEEDA